MKELFIQQKIFSMTDHYPITDEEGNMVYKVDQEFYFFKKVLYVSDAFGEHLFTVRSSVFRIFPRFDIDFADGEHLELQTRFRFVGRRIDVNPKSTGITVEGDYLSRSFSVFRQEEMIGMIDRKIFSLADKFKIEVYNEEYQDLFVAIMIAVDIILDVSKL